MLVYMALKGLNDTKNIVRKTVPNHNSSMDKVYPSLKAGNANHGLPLTIYHLSWEFVLSCSSQFKERFDATNLTR